MILIKKNNLKKIDNLLFQSKKILQIFKFYIPAQDAKLKSVWAPFLTPFLGKEKLNSFCDIYNKETSLLYNKKILVPTNFLLFENNTYTFLLKTPTLFFLLKYLYNLDKLYNLSKNAQCFYYITLEELFLIFNIKESLFINYNKKVIFIILMKIIKNFGIKIINK
jgi:ribosomal protein L11